MAGKIVTRMGVWQGVTMDSLKFHSGLPNPTLLRTEGWPPLKRSYGPQVAAIFYPFGHPTPYAYGIW
jgi:hypothetical protein